MFNKTELFRRYCRVVVGSIEILNTSLDVAFTVSKSLKPEPNKAEIKIWNLNEGHRNQLEQLQVAPVLIDAGYVTGHGEIFSGDLRTALTLREGPDLITSLASGDGETAFRGARVKLSVPKGASADTIIRNLARALGVGEGNLNRAVALIKKNLAGYFSEGTVLIGSASREMTHACRSCGLDWSIQRGHLLILPKGKALEGKAIKITPDTGLVGSPTVDNKGVLKCKMLMIPEVTPGRLMVLESERISGQYRIETTQHTGDIGGDDWYIEVEARRY